jgi:ATP-binding cassette subfamily E protein 1
LCDVAVIKDLQVTEVLISGINIFLDGFVPTENLRFRDESLVFKVAESATEEEVRRMNHYEYPGMTKTMGSFHLTVEQGQFSDSEILVLLGENGTGKTTFIRMLAGKQEPDEGPGECLIYVILFTDREL